MTPDTTNPPWSPAPENKPQQMAYDLARSGRVMQLGYGGQAGGGKALTLETPVLTPFGWKPAHAVRVGDMLSAADGTATKVLAVYPQHQQPLYTFTFADGATVTVTEDHLWLYWYAGERFKAPRQYLLYNPEKGVHQEGVQGRLGLSKTLFAYHQKQVAQAEAGQRPHWLIMPLPEPVQFTRPRNRSITQHWLSPYLLGILIAEGSLNRSSPAVTSADVEIMAQVEAELPDGDSLGFEDGFTRGIVGGATRKALAFFGLMGCVSNEKHISEAYLYAPREDRFALMQGLMDGDGYVDGRGHMSYTTVSAQLAQDVQHLARSLGAKATLTQKQGGYVHPETGELVETQIAYTVYIQSQYADQFARLPRKRDRCKPYNGGVSTLGRRVVNIEPAGMGDGVCFALDHPSGLHVVKDFIVTHNTDLGLGLASTVFHKTLFFRSEFTQLTDVIERGNQLFPVPFVAGDKKCWRFGGRLIRLRHAQQEGDWKKYQGQSNDLIVFDEAAEFGEGQVRSISGWARTTTPGRHTLILLCFNPPTTAEGEWIVQMFAPWIDPEYAGDKAQPGEIRWFWRDEDDRERECESGAIFEYKDRTVYPISRTFIPASRHDNPYLGEQYERQLDSTPEPLRTMLMEGDFTVTAKPDRWQVIPTAWILQAQQRWRESGKPDLALRSVGVDVARGGDDQSAMAKLYGTWFAPLIVQPGAETPDGMAVAQLVLTNLEMPAPVNIDVIGIGASAYDQLTLQAPESVMITPINNAVSVPGTDKSGVYPFANLRAASYWRLREALDPLSGEELMLPDDRLLRVELSAPRYKITGGKIRVEPKEDIIKRIGHSPDRADAVVLAWWGVCAPAFAMEWVSW